MGAASDGAPRSAGNVYEVDRREVAASMVFAQAGRAHLAEEDQRCGAEVEVAAARWSEAVHALLKDSSFRFYSWVYACMLYWNGPRSLNGAGPRPASFPNWLISLWCAAPTWAPTHDSHADEVWPCEGHKRASQLVADEENRLR